MTQDRRLDRLYDYTKFHVGIYITAMTALIALGGANKRDTYLGGLISCPKALWIAIGTMALAGLSGGVILSACTLHDTLSSFWGEQSTDEKIGPYGRKCLHGKWWARIEHTSFWISASCFGLAVLY